MLDQMMDLFGTQILRILGSAFVLTSIAKVLDAQVAFPGGKETNLAMAVKCATLVHHLGVGCLGTYALYTEYGQALTETASLQTVAAAEPLANRPSHLASILTDISVGYMVFDFYYISTWSSGEFLLMMMHHILSIVLWPISSFTGWGQGWILWFLSMEISSIFMALRWVFKTAGLEEKSPICMLNGFLFTLVFFVWRIVPIPVYLLAFYLAPGPSSTAHIMSKGLSAATGDQVLVAGKVMGYICTLPIFLNLFWFYQLVNMLRKMFSKKKEKKNR